MFKLALQLGCTVAELCDRLSFDEFIDWLAYDGIDPFGGFRQDIQTATLLYAKVGQGSLTDYLPIDPNPMSEEMRERYEYEQALKNSEKEARQLAEMLGRLEDKANKH